MTNIGYLSLSEASALIRTRELSSEEYTRALLNRISRFDGKLNAFIRLMPDEAMAAAKEADRQLATGSWRGPLHGVPFGLKDIIDSVGVPTTCHSKILVDNIAKSDAEVTRRLRRAGGILVGKLATHEFAFGGPSFDLPWPPAINPWGHKCHPGGSSSGSGAALAAGFLPAALGTDTGGSIRNPASMCGIVGLKPTYGLVSRRGVFPLSYSLDHVGPMTRTVRDNAHLLQILAGHDPEDPGSSDVPVSDYTKDLDAGVKGLRIGVIRHFYTRDMTAHPQQAAAIEAAIETYRKLGAEVTEISLPPMAEYVAVNRIVLKSEAFAIHRKWLTERPQDYGDSGRERLLDGATISAADYVDALRLRGRLIKQTLDAFAAIDVAVTASSMDPACRIDDADAVARTYPRQARQPFNVTGQPAISIPCGFSSGGLPLSLQIVGHPFQEAMVYRVANAYERETQWVTQHPPEY